MATPKEKRKEVSGKIVLSLFSGRDSPATEVEGIICESPIPYLTLERYLEWIRAKKSCSERRSCTATPSQGRLGLDPSGKLLGFT